MGIEFPREESDNFLTIFGLQANAMGGGGDRGQAFPASDAVDFSNGARFVPGEVTLERRAGRNVRFVRECDSPCCWFWELENGDRIYHWDPLTYASIGRHNHGETWLNKRELAGACPRCGNTQTNGGKVATKPDASAE